MGDQPIVGEELKLLRMIAERGPWTVREASDAYGAANGVRLTTVQQMMERLRKKGELTREPSLRGLLYRSVRTVEELMGGAVRDFVDRSLEGSLTPFALYLAERGHDIPDHEIAELRRIIDRLSGEGDA